ncbi:protein pleiotropic regulatory locus 1 [Daucus carota subsp. sativus]|nr:PREDICTED: protein pleiotropic regulatory locus 1-like [Daucus carota subsp. sativus]
MMETTSPVQPESLCSKSIKRAHHNNYHFPPDSQAKKIRMTHKLNLEQGTSSKSSAQPVPETSRNSENLSDHRASSAKDLKSPWKKYRVISSHVGCVRCVAFDPSNHWFCTGSADRTIRIFDVATGSLKHTLTGHIGQVRSVAVSNRQPYMFSGGDDKLVKCWDLEHNKVVRSFHGHLSGVYCLAVHPTIDVVITGGRDCVGRVWDVRTRQQVFALSGHGDTVCSVLARSVDPQVVTGSHDTTVKLWDLRDGRTMGTLTHHKKAVRALVQHPVEDAFASASADNVKKFGLPRGEFLDNMVLRRKMIVNAMAVNKDGVLVTGGDDGSVSFYDWKTCQNFQQIQTTPQPGSLDCEAAIYAAAFDVTGSRLVTCEADKTIKMWKQGTY